MSWLHDTVEAIFAVIAWPAAMYFLLANTSMLGLVLLAARHFARYLRRATIAATTRWPRRRSATA